MPCSTDRLALGFGQADKASQRGHLRLGNRTAVGAPGQGAQNAIDTDGAAPVGIAGQDFLAAGALGLERERAHQGDRIQKLVRLAVVSLLLRQAFHGGIINETGPECVVSFRQRQPEFLHRIGVKVDEARGFGLDRHAVQQFAIHPETHRHRLGILGALAGQTNANEILTVPFHPMRGFDGREIRTPHGLVLDVILKLERLGGEGVGAQGAGGNALGGVDVFLHQQR